MPPLSNDIFGALQRLQQLQETAAAQPVDADTAQRLADYHVRYPWMSPDAKWSLASSGLPATDPSAQAAAAAAAHIEVTDGLGFQPVGSPVTKPAGNPDVFGILSRLDSLRQQAQSITQSPSYAAGAPSSAIQQIAGDQWDKLDPTVRDELSKVGLTEGSTGESSASYGLQGYESLSPAAWTAFNDIVAKWGQSKGFIAYVSGEKNTSGQFINPPTVELTTPVKQGDPLTGGAAGPIDANPIIRTAGMVLSAPLQELEGQFRNVAALAQSVHEGHPENPNWLQSQSDLGVAVGDVLGRRKVDVGSGFFVDPASPLEQERQRRLLQRGNIGGQPITLGRAFASDVLRMEPGTAPANLVSGLVDAGKTLAVDPAIWAGKGLAAVREADQVIGAENSASKALQVFRETGQVTEGLKAFQDAGGISGLRFTVSPDAARAWVTAPEQAPLLQKIADTNDTATIWRALGKQVDPGVAAELADATSTDQVANILRDQLGSTLRNTVSTSDFPSSLLHSPADLDSPSLSFRTPRRWTAMMPHQAVDGNDAVANALQVDRVAALVKAPNEQYSQWFDAMARAATPLERQSVYEQMMNDTAERLLGKGVAADRAKKLTQMYGEQQAVDRAYAVREVAAGRGNLTSQVSIDGKPMFVADNQPTMLAQTVDGNIPMPDWRALRRGLAAKPVRAVLENPLVAGADYGLNRLQSSVWKALQISTVKTMIKVLGDEQAAIAARGYDSLLTHPISALSTILATPLGELPEDAGYLARLRHASAGLLRGTVEHLPGVEPTLTSTALGHDFETLDEVQRVASHGLNTATDDLGVLRANDWKVLERQPGVNDAEFLDAHARHLAQYNASPEMRGFANAGSLEQAQDWYWDGPGAKYRELFAKSGRQGQPELRTREGADAYVAKSMNQMQEVTNGNPKLMAAIADGNLDGSKVWSTVQDGSPRVSKNFMAKLDGYQSDFPLATPQQKALYSSDLARKQVADGIFGRAIHTLLGTPSAVLSKSPLFRQAYWERIIDNAPFLTADAQAEAVRIAENEANLSPKLLDELKQSIAAGNRGRTPFSGTLGLEQADEIAKGHGLKIVQQTTHEFSDRSQAFDMLRLLTPFGEVWRKTILRWGRIIAENPNVVRRGMEGFQALQSPDLGSLTGQPAGQGFFHKDQYGQEVFTVPGSEWATQALTGVPVPLVGDVKGLSLGTEFWPALGPAASIPVAWTLQKLNAPRSITETLFPYGPPKEANDLWNYAPSWLQKAAGHDRPTSPDSVRTFNNTVIDMVRYGLTNGDYDLHTPEGIQHAMEDATNKAHSLYDIRAAAQFFVPGAPSPELLVRDKSGKLVDAAALIQEFHDLQNQDPNTAGQVFLDKYGPDIFEAVTPKSYSYTFGIPTSREAADWVDAHSDVKRDFPHVYGYFAPPSDPNSFDYEVYRDQLQPGQGRAALSAQQWAQIANARLAGMQYGKIRDRVDAQNAKAGVKENAAQRQWLAAVKQNLMNEYPGYADSVFGGGASPGLPARPDPGLLVREAQQAVNNPTVQGTDAGQGLALYLKRRDEADAAWVAAGHSSGSWTQASGDYAIALRAWLGQIAIAVEGAHPQFGPLFESVFAREMKDDTNPAALTPGG